MKLQNNKNCNCKFSDNHAAAANLNQTPDDELPSNYIKCRNSFTVTGSYG